jgi:hypothetical protein
MLRIVFAGLVSFLFLTSCQTLSPFTQELRQDIALTDSELDRIQFYLSKDIVMRREFSGSQSRIEGGEIKVVDGRKVEEVIIARRTPGVLLFSPERDTYAIGFEEGFNNRYLMFGPNPRSGGQFVLLASEWKSNVGRVTYDNRAYWVEVDRYGAVPGLLVNLKKINQRSVKSRRAGGRKID